MAHFTPQEAGIISWMRRKFFENRTVTDLTSANDSDARGFQQLIALPDDSGQIPPVDLAGTVSAQRLADSRRAIAEDLWSEFVAQSADVRVTGSSSLTARELPHTDLDSTSQKTLSLLIHQRLQTSDIARPDWWTKSHPWGGELGFNYSGVLLGDPFANQPRPRPPATQEWLDAALKEELIYHEAYSDYVDGLAPPPRPREPFHSPARAWRGYLEVFTETGPRFVQDTDRMVEAFSLQQVVKTQWRHRLQKRYRSADSDDHQGELKALLSLSIGA